MDLRFLAQPRAFGLALALLLTQGTAVAMAGPFSGMEGSWSGAGALSKSDGSRESLRCRAEYRVEQDGDVLNLHIRCASDSYNFDLSGYAANRGGAISGQWSETTLNSSGTLSGRVAGGHLRAQAIGNNFSAGLSMTTGSSRQQSVTIEPQATDVTRVSLTLRRR
jgi:hypothetical protein